MSALDDFASRNRLKIRRDDDFTRFIPGRDGQVYEYSDTQLVVLVTSEKPRVWTLRRNQCLAEGMTLLQNGDLEGSLLFNWRNPLQAAMAIKVAHIKRKRRVSPETREMLARNREKLSQERAQEGENERDDADPAQDTSD